MDILRDLHNLFLLRILIHLINLYKEKEGLFAKQVPVGSSVQVQLRTEIGLIITVRPTPPQPNKYI